MYNYRYIHEGLSKTSGSTLKLRCKLVRTLKSYIACWLWSRCMMRGCCGSWQPSEAMPRMSSVRTGTRSMRTCLCLAATTAVSATGLSLTQTALRQVAPPLHVTHCRADMLLNGTPPARSSELEFLCWLTVTIANANAVSVSVFVCTCAPCSTHASAKLRSFHRGFHSVLNVQVKLHKF